MTYIPPITDSEDEKFYNWFKQNVLRKAFRRWPPYTATLLAAKEGRMVGKAWRVSFKCAKCKQKYSRKEVSVDHITPIGGKGVPLDALVRRMFCGVDNLQVLCSYKLKAVQEGKYDTPSCHYIKSCEERGHVAKTTEELRRPKKTKPHKSAATKTPKKNKRRRALGTASGEASARR